MSALNELSRERQGEFARVDGELVVVTDLRWLEDNLVCVTRQSDGFELWLFWGPDYECWSREDNAQQVEFELQ